LAPCDGVAEKLVDVLHRPKRYRDLVEEVRKHLLAHYAYQNRVQELTAALLRE